jgi:hypothetical protein
MQGEPAPRGRETTRIRKRNPLGLILAGAAAAALALGIALAAGSSPPPEAAPLPSGPAAAPVQVQLQPKSPPAPALEELLSRVREISQADLMFERRDEVVGLLKEAAGRAGSRLEEVDQIAAQYGRKFEQAAARVADFTQAEAKRVAAKQRYAEAIERLDGYPAAFKASRSAEQIRALRHDFERQRAESALPASPPQRQIASRP